MANTIEKRLHANGTLVRMDNLFDLTAEDLAVFRTACRFRKAIELCDAKELPFWFGAFPLGACDDTARFLAKYLRTKGYGTFEHVSGWNHQNGQRYRSHAWLEQGKLIVDITADQFPNNDSPVIVTRNHDWHDQFVVDSRSPIGLESFNDEPHLQLNETYDAIISRIADE